MAELCTVQMRSHFFSPEEEKKWLLIQFISAWKDCTCLLQIKLRDKINCTVDFLNFCLLCVFLPLNFSLPEGRNLEKLCTHYCTSCACHKMSLKVKLCCYFSLLCTYFLDHSAKSDYAVHAIKIMSLKVKLCCIFFTLLCT